MSIKGNKRVAMAPQRQFTSDEINEPIVQSVQVEAFIWDRDSHGLFDYESKTIVRQSIKCTGCIFISRLEQELKVLLPNVDNQEDYQNLLSLVYKQGQYWMYHSKSLQDDSFKNHVDRVWRIVKYETFTTGKQNTFKVIQGDTIKFGRVRFQIKKLHVDPNDVEKYQEENNTNNNEENDSDRRAAVNVNNRVLPGSISIDNSQTQNQMRLMTTEQDVMSVGNATEPDTRMTQNFNIRETVGFDNRPITFQDEKIQQQEQEIKFKAALLNRQQSLNKSQIEAIACKICLSEEEPNNPMISPCNCTGSMKYIHLDCLREWLEGKKHMKETPWVNSYIWKNLECEICKHSYNDMITLKDGRIVSLLNYSVHDDSSSYMIIESVTNTTSKTIHVINFNQKRKVRVGRGQNAEVRITDISVSRFHTLIKLNKRGEVIIQDNQSKFGTLVQLTDPLPVKLNQPLYLQIGRVVAVIFAVQRFSCIQRCFCALTKARKREQSLHYDEVHRYFPQEFQSLFNKDITKPIKAMGSQIDFRNGVLGPYRQIGLQQQIHNHSLDVSSVSQNDGRHFDYQQQEIHDQEVVLDQQQQRSSQNQSRQGPRQHLQNPLQQQQQNQANNYNNNYIAQNILPLSNNQHQGPTMRDLRDEDRQVSVAIEFATNIDRIDSENRQQIVNNLVHQMNNISRARDAVSRVESNQLATGQENNSHLPTFSNVPNLSNLQILREEDEEDKDGNSVRLDYQEHRNPMSYLNSDRSQLEQEQRQDLINSSRAINNLILNPSNPMINQGQKGRSRLNNNQSYGGFPNIQLMSPTHTNREASIFSVSRYNDIDEEEQRQLEMIQENHYEEVKVSQVERMDISDLPINYNNTFQTNTNSQNPNNRTQSMFNQFDKNLRLSTDKQIGYGLAINAGIQEQKQPNIIPPNLHKNIQHQPFGNASVLTTLQATDSNQNNPTALNFSSTIHQETINETNNINLSGKKREWRNQNKLETDDQNKQNQ